MTPSASCTARSTKADFVKALLVSIDENRGTIEGRLPPDFSMSDGSIASLVNCGLDLSDEESVEGRYIKRLRQRERDRERGR